MSHTVHFEPVVYHCRVYGEGKSFENKDNYDAIFNVQIIGEKAYISGYHGDYNRDVVRQTTKHLHSIGIFKYEYETSTGHHYEGDI